MSNNHLLKRTTNTRGNIEPAKQQSLSGKKTTTTKQVPSIRPNLGEGKHIAADCSIPNRCHASGSIERHVPSGEIRMHTWLSALCFQFSTFGIRLPTIIVTMPFIDDLPIMTDGNKAILQAMPTDITYIVFDRLSLEIETLLVILPRASKRIAEKVHRHLC
ncbi:hypothetical protein PENSOL_c001G11507 [Penicillium solitum]|uniref:Uncharacterized protein n=1 Tax=Penicillium solitum TaxID=60172 RepID=A0A1V6RPL0_9EURO|nr:uncharacterized protein PENSOL_c001G11507 [Penicillium solitum]OQE03721.1 hypothetical protein PENSOL_c001G11507 [Penicillium solitum]